MFLSSHATHQLSHPLSRHRFLLSSFLQLICGHRTHYHHPRLSLYQGLLAWVPEAESVPQPAISYSSTHTSAEFTRGTTSNAICVYAYVSHAYVDLHVCIYTHLHKHLQRERDTQASEQWLHQMAPTSLSFLRSLFRGSPERNSNLAKVILYDSNSVVLTSSKAFSNALDHVSSWSSSWEIWEWLQIEPQHLCRRT